MYSFIFRFRDDEQGATAIEYSLIAAFIALAIITTALSLGTEVSSTFTSAETGLKKRPAV